MKKEVILCVDLITLMKNGELKVMDSRKGTLFRNEEDKFTFTERGARPHEVRLEKHWQVLDRCRYGKVSANDAHIKLELYIPHGEYANGHDLADLLAQQVEQMGDNLCEMDLQQLVDSIRALKK
jgi:hypothetical protein